MRIKQLGLGMGLATMLLVTTGTMATNSVTAQAATKNHSFKVANVFFQDKYRKSKLTKKTTKPVRVYTNRYLKSYVVSKTTKQFYSTESLGMNKVANVTRKSDGKTFNYRYVRSANGKVKGWVAASALKGKLGKQVKVPAKQQYVIVTKAGLKRMLDLADNFLAEKKHSKATRQNVIDARKAVLKDYKSKTVSNNKKKDDCNFLRITMTNLDKKGNWVPVG